VTETLYASCGGPVFWLLAALAAAACSIFFVRLMGFRRAHVDYADFIRGVGNVLAHGNPDEAIAICTETNAPVARIVAAALHHREGSARALREAVDAAGRAEVSRLGRRLASLALISQAAPLLSLLGAVQGLVQTALALNKGVLVARADLLGGLTGALSVVFAGVLVALVSQMMYGILRIRLDRLVSELEAAASEIISLLTARREEARA